MRIVQARTMLAAGLAVVCVLVAPAAAGSPAPGTDDPAVTSSEGVEVNTYGTVPVWPNAFASIEPVYLSVHAVQRVESATVVYLSVGWPDRTDRAPSITELGGQYFDNRNISDGTSLQSVRVPVPEANVLLAPLPQAGINRPRAFSSSFEALPAEPGVLGVLWTVLPPIPDGVDAVDVHLSVNAMVPDVPVGDGLLEPVVDGPVVPLGSGWPEVPIDELADIDRPELSVLPLTARKEALDNSSREAETADQVTIDVSADVLFAVDSATLSPDATARLDAVATDITDRSAPGPVGVVGHTDSDGTDAYNLDLSQRRAQSVADALARTAPGLDLVVDGRGESDPVASNATPEGKQLNRRVTITFAPINELAP